MAGFSIYRRKKKNGKSIFYCFRISCLDWIIFFLSVFPMIFEK